MGLLSELEPLVVEAEAALDEVKEAVTALSKEGGLASEKEVTKAVEAVNKATEQSKDKSKVCTDFIKEKGADLKAPRFEKKEEKKDEKKEENNEDKEEAEKKPTYAALQKRVTNAVNA